MESEIFIPPAQVRRVTQGGLADPNAGAKDKTEAKLLAFLAALFGVHLGELLAKLGKPPDLGKIPTALWVRWEEELARGIRPVLNEAAVTAGERLILEQNFPVSKERVARGARRWSVARSLGWATAIVLATRRATRERVGRFLAEPGRDLAEDLGFHFGKARAETEAVTETTGAFTQGERIVTDTIQTEAVWRTMRDELVCDLCRPLDGLPEGQWGILPDFPPLHFNCRCWLTYAGFGDQPPGRWQPGLDRPHVGGLPGRDRPYIEGIIL